MTSPITPKTSLHVSCPWMPNALLAGDDAVVTVATIEQLVQARDAYDDAGEAHRYAEVVASLMCVRAARTAIYEAMALD